MEVIGPCDCRVGVTTSPTQKGREIYYNSKNETHYRSYDSYGNEVYHGYYPAKGNSRREWTEYEYYPNGQLKSKKIYTFSKN